MVDAYKDITIPFQMSTIEFFNSVKSHLNKNGVMVVNMNMTSDKDGSINNYLEDTIKSCFNSVYTCTYGGNKELFASNDYDVKESLSAKIKGIADTKLKLVINTVYRNMEEVTTSNYILTDDKAPVEVLGMQVLDEIIVEELSYIKQTIKGKSLKELLDMVLSGSF
jgi:hypothetical protein